MPKSAIQSFNKILKKCPKCDDNAPKELVAIGTSKKLLAHCSACGFSFDTAGRGCFGWIALGMFGVFALGGVSVLFGPKNFHANSAAESPVAEPVATSASAEIDFKAIVKNPAFYPGSVVTKEELTFAAILNGKQVGTFKVPPNTLVQLLSVSPDGTLEVAVDGGRAATPWTKTNFREAYSQKKLNSTVPSVNGAAQVSVKKILYTVVLREALRRNIAIDGRNLNEQDLIALGEQLKEENRGVSATTVLIYSDARAAEMYQRLNSLTPAETTFLQRNFVARYFKNTHTGTEEYEIHPLGMNGPSKTVLLR